jgi:hypothetical protein
MTKELIQYETEKDIIYPSNLRDLSGIVGDMEELVGYLRDLSKQLVPLTENLVPLSKSLVPLSKNLNEMTEKVSDKVIRFFDSEIITIAGISCCVLLCGYFGTGIMKNILEIKAKKNSEL